MLLSYNLQHQDKCAADGGCPETQTTCLSESWRLFILAVQVDVNDSRRDLLHHVSDEVVLVAETVGVLLTWWGENTASAKCRTQTHTPEMSGRLPPHVSQQ